MNWFNRTDDDTNWLCLITLFTCINQMNLDYVIRSLNEWNCVKPMHTRVDRYNTPHKCALNTSIICQSTIEHTNTSTLLSIKFKYKVQFLFTYLRYLHFRYGVPIKGYIYICIIYICSGWMNIHELYTFKYDMYRYTRIYVCMCIVQCLIYWTRIKVCRRVWTR